MSKNPNRRKPKRQTSGQERDYLNQLKAEIKRQGWPAVIKKVEIEKVKRLGLRYGLPYRLQEHPKKPGETRQQIIKEVRKILHGG